MARPHPAKRRGTFSCYTPRSCRGRYHTDRQPGDSHLHLHGVSTQDIAAILDRRGNQR